MAAAVSHSYNLHTRMPVKHKYLNGSAGNYTAHLNTMQHFCGAHECHGAGKHKQLASLHQPSVLKVTAHSYRLTLVIRYKGAEMYPHVELNEAINAATFSVE